MKPITDLIPILEDFHKIIITTHASPDADALGSSLGLFHFLKANLIVRMNSVKLKSQIRIDTGLAFEKKKYLEVKEAFS